LYQKENLTQPNACLEGCDEQNILQVIYKCSPSRHSINRRVKRERLVEKNSHITPTQCVEDKQKESTVPHACFCSRQNRNLAVSFSARQESTLSFSRSSVYSFVSSLFSFMCFPPFTNEDCLSSLPIKAQQPHPYYPPAQPHSSPPPPDSNPLISPPHA
jgi:hypothetical protein